MSRYNAVISIERYGERNITVTKVVHGMSVFTFNNDQSRSRRRQQFLTYKRTSGSFSIDVVCTTFEEYHGLLEWLQGWLFRSTVMESFVYPARVIVPSRNFDKTGFLESDLQFGEEVATIAYKTRLDFMGSSSRIEQNLDNFSKFELPTADDPALPYMYPAGSQLSGMMMGKDAILETTEFDSVPDIDTSSTRTKRRSQGRGGT